MDLDDQMRRYFGTADVSAVPPPALAAGIEHMRVDLGLERNRSRLNQAATLRAEAAERRTDSRGWVVQRRTRTRHLIELGGLV